METNETLLIAIEKVTYNSHDIALVSRDHWIVVSEGDELYESDAFFAATTCGACKDMIDEVMADMIEERETDSHNDALAIRSSLR